MICRYCQLDGSTSGRLQCDVCRRLLSLTDLCVNVTIPSQCHIRLRKPDCCLRVKGHIEIVDQVEGKVR